MSTETYYSIHNKLNFSLTGDSSLLDYLRYQYKDFSIEKHSGSANISCNIGLQEATSNSFDRIIKHSNSEFYASDYSRNKYIWSHGGEKLLLDANKRLASQSEVLFTSSFNKMKAGLFCELIWRLALVPSELSLFHAACVAKGDRTILFLSGKGVGKTALAVKLVDQGYEFLADDRVWVSNQSEVFSYPRYVVVKDSNIDFFPQLKSCTTNLKRFLYTVASKIPKLNKSSFFFRAKSLIYPAKYYYISELLPNAVVRNNSTLTEVVYVSKSATVTESYLHPLIVKETKKAVSLINELEWNHPLFPMVAAHDILFPESPSWVDEMNSLLAFDQKIVNKVLSQISCSELVLPESYDLKQINQVIDLFA